VAVRRTHHGNFDALIAQSSDTSGPLSFNGGPAFELEAELAKEINRRCEVIDDDSYVVHPSNGHASNLQSAVYSDNRLLSFQARGWTRALFAKSAASRSDKYSSQKAANLPSPRRRQFSSRRDHCS